MSVWIRSVLLNLVLIIFMLFFTTPTIILEKLGTFGTASKVEVYIHKI